MFTSPPGNNCKLTISHGTNFPWGHLVVRRPRAERNIYSRSARSFQFVPGCCIKMGVNFWVTSLAVKKKTQNKVFIWSFEAGWEADRARSSEAQKTRCAMTLWHFCCENLIELKNKIPKFCKVTHWKELSLCRWERSGRSGTYRTGDKGSERVGRKLQSKPGQWNQTS